MLAAIALAGMASLLFKLNAFGGYALELETFYLLGGLSVMLLGAGRLSLNIGGTVELSFLLLRCYGGGDPRSGEGADAGRPPPSPRCARHLPVTTGGKSSIPAAKNAPSAPPPDALHPPATSVHAR